MSGPSSTWRGSRPGVRGAPAGTPSSSRRWRRWVSTTAPAQSQLRIIDLEGLGLDQGGHLLLKRALVGVVAGERVEVRGTAPELAVHVRAWCRAQGHGYDWPFVVRGAAAGARRRGGETAGGPSEVADRAPATWGLAARGAVVEAGGPAFAFALD